MKNFIRYIFLAAIFLAVSCQKTIGINEQNASHSFQAPFTERQWVMDTIIITPPANYNFLSDADKINFQHQLSWFSNAVINFKEDGSVNSDEGDWDFGYQKWRLINDNKDIEVSLSDKKDTLYSWHFDDTKFSYNKNLSPEVPCTFIYK